MPATVPDRVDRGWAIRGDRWFDDDTELAELASLGVCVNIRAGEVDLAARLQPVARAAWDRVAGGSDDLREEAERAQAAIRLRVGAAAERRFLRQVIDYASESPPGDPGVDRKIDATRG